MHFILCEQSGAWSDAIRDRLSPGMALIELRQVEEIWPALNRQPAAIVAVEFEAQRAQELLSALTRMAREYPLALPLVVASPQHARWAPALREAGALHVVTSLRRVAELIQITARHASRLQTELADDPRLPPRPQPSIEERILASLPWGE